MEVSIRCSGDMQRSNGTTASWVHFKSSTRKFFFYLAMAKVENRSEFFLIEGEFC